MRNLFTSLFRIKSAVQPGQRVNLVDAMGFGARYDGVVLATDSAFALVEWPNGSTSEVNSYNLVPIVA